jgi:transposase
MSRLLVKAVDHDFSPQEKVTPFGIFLPGEKQLYLYLTSSSVTSDFIVDCIADFWNREKYRFPLVKKLVINADNGPENHSRRTQFMKRITQFTDEFDLTVQLAYYPPYHSKYNPIERVWGVFERHINGSLIDSLTTVVSFAKTMTYNAVQPVVTVVETLYHKGVSFSQKAMKELEKRFIRLNELEKWFVTIEPRRV